MFGGIAPKSEQLQALRGVVALDGLGLDQHRGVAARSNLPPWERLKISMIACSPLSPTDRICGRGPSII